MGFFSSRGEFACRQHRSNGALLAVLVACAHAFVACGGNTGNAANDGSETQDDASGHDASAVDDATGHDASAVDAAGTQAAACETEGTCVCTPGTKTSCYDGAQGTVGVGTCHAGEKTCAADGLSYGACVGQVLPAAEVCNGTLEDEDCDGEVNEDGTGCDCVPGTTEPCWEGPQGSVFGGSSICQKGTHVCSNEGKWGTCNGQVLPQVEPVGVCTDSIDEDCDGDAAGPGAVDADGDGWSPCDGDCCDVTALCASPADVNPGAFDVAGNDFDDDCNGSKDDVPTSCDSGLSSNSSSVSDYAKALDLCQFTSENPSPLARKWGVITTSFSRSDGSGSPDPNARSIRPHFGTKILPLQGESLAVLSTGNAAAINDTNPNYVLASPGTDFHYASDVPADWLAANGGKVPHPAQCEDFGAPHDGVLLKLRIRVPTNARSFSFDSLFMSAEYPEYTCSQYNDVFVTLLDSKYVSNTTPNPSDKNIVASANYNPISSNLAVDAPNFFQVCEASPLGCNAMASVTPAAGVCSLGSSLLASTGMDVVAGGCGSSTLTGGGTGYLTSQANVVPGETIELRFVIWDSGDGAGDSHVVLDNFKWSTTPVTPGTSPR